MTQDSAVQDVMAVLDRLDTAYAEADADGILAPFTTDAVRFVLGPPLRQAPGTIVGDVDGVRSWLAGFAGGVTMDRRDVIVETSGDLAMVTALSRMSATTAGGDDFAFWFRSTFGLRRTDGEWRIAHEHASTPFYMDGTFRTALDLQP